MFDDVTTSRKMAADEAPPSYEKLFPNLLLNEKQPLKEVCWRCNSIELVHFRAFAPLKLYFSMQWLWAGVGLNLNQLLNIVTMAYDVIAVGTVRSGLKHKGTGY